MASPISNTSSSSCISMLEEGHLTTSNNQPETSSIFKMPSSFTDESYEESVRTNDLGVGFGITKRVRGLLSSPKVLGKDLLIETINCIGITAFTAWTTAYPGITLDDIANGTKEKFMDAITNQTIDSIQIEQFTYGMEEFFWSKGIWTFTAVTAAHIGVTALQLCFLIKTGIDAKNYTFVPKALISGTVWSLAGISYAVPNLCPPLSVLLQGKVWELVTKKHHCSYVPQAINLAFIGGLASAGLHVVVGIGILPIYRSVMKTAGKAFNCLSCYKQ